MNLQKIAKLDLKQKQSIDKDKAYAEGFAQKCAEHNINPQKVLDIVKALEIHL